MEALGVKGEMEKHSKSARSRKIFVVSRENTMDSDHLLEEDQYYNVVGPILWILRILAVYSFKHLRPGGTEFRFWSLPTLYTALGITPWHTSGCWLLTYLMSYLHEEMCYPKYIMKILLLVVVESAMIIPVMHWRDSPTIAMYMQNWTKYQAQYRQVTGTSLQLRLRRRVYKCLALVLCSTVCTTYFSLPEHSFGTIVYVYATVTLNLMGVLWHINCAAISRSGEQLERALRQIITSQSFEASSIAAIKNLWLDLSEIVQQLGYAYSQSFIHFITISFLMFAGGAFCHFTAGFRMSQSIIAFQGLIMLLVFCFGGFQASEKVSGDIKKLLLSMSASSMDTNKFREVELFLTAVSTFPPTVSLAGSVHVNRKLFTTAMMTAASYGVILLQFKVGWSESEPRLKKSSADVAMPKFTGDPVTETTTEGTPE